MNEEPIRVYVRGLNNTPTHTLRHIELGSMGPCFHEVYWVYWALWVGQIKEMSDQCCLAIVFLGHRYRSHWMHGDPFLALRFCQTAWSLRGVLFGSSHMRCYSSANNVLACCVYTLSACTHVLGMRIFVRNFIFLLFVYKSEQHFSSVRPLGPWNHIPYHKE